MMPSITLSRRPLRVPAAVTLCPAQAELVLGRAHEACGPARHVFAMALAARMQGPVIWVRLGWQTEKLHADGMRAYINPARLLFVDARRPEDLLWTVEETLRTGAVPLVVAELPEPPSLTPIRRLHLAAETGGKTGSTLPLALLLTPADGGAQGVETRWHMAPRAGQSRWTLTRLRARMEMPKSWAADWIAGQLTLQDMHKPETQTASTLYATV